MEPWCPVPSGRVAFFCPRSCDCGALHKDVSVDGCVGGFWVVVVVVVVGARAAEGAAESETKTETRKSLKRTGVSMQVAGMRSIHEQEEEFGQEY